MGKRVFWLWLTWVLTWVYIVGVPCFAQAPDQEPNARPTRPNLVPMEGGPGRLIVVGPGQARPGMRPWGPEQATGAPDTEQAGDIPTAWASLEPNAGAEWLHVDYDQAVTIAEVRIRESFNPGAVSKVVAILNDGKERALWEGFDPTVDAPADFVVKAEGDVVSKSIKIYLDTTRKDGWNEIDAVELAAKDGKRQWASHTTASSTYAALTERPMGVATVVTEPLGPSKPTFAPYGPRMLDPFADLGQRRVTVYLEGGKVVSGTFVRSAGGFIVIEQPEAHKTLIVNTQRMLYLETAE